MKRPFYGLLTNKIGKKLDKQFDFIKKFSFKESKGRLWVKKALINNYYLFNKIENESRYNFIYLNSQLNQKIRQIDYCETSTNFYIFPLLVKNRDLLVTKLFENNIEAGKHFQKSIEWAKDFGYIQGLCKNTEIIVTSIITIPVNNTIKEKELDSIAKIINEHDCA